VIDDLDRVLDAALGIDGADDVEVRASRHTGGLTRFANSTVHQHVQTDATSLSIRVAIGQRVGATTTNDVTPEGAARAAAAAVAAARLTPPDPTYPGMAGPASLPETGPRADPATAGAAPADRVAAVATLLAQLRPGQTGAGALETGCHEVAYATTAGARHDGTATRASLSAVVTGGGATGHAEDASSAMGDLDAADVGERAAATCAAAVDPAEHPPGDLDVVLLPSAVMTMLEYLSFTTFSAKAVQEGRSAFAERLGHQVASPLVGIADDPLGPGSIGLTFDGEGTPRRRVELIVEGVATGMVHDRATAKAAGVESTGHGLPGPNPWGPFAGSLVLSPGTSTLDDLIGGVDAGLLVTRFWYARTVNAKRTIITGMTRDGTFRIEGGAVGPPVRNLRFNQSILDALAACDGVGDLLRTCNDESSDTRCPAIRIRGFTFTSSSDH
jgi:predicted Zn-dependent protease